MQIKIIHKYLNKSLQIFKIRNYKKLNQENRHTFLKPKNQNCVSFYSQANFKPLLPQPTFLYHFKTPQTSKK